MNSYDLNSNAINELALLSTNETAEVIGFQPQTLRKWAMDGSGPIQPIKIGNRLRWKLKDIKKLCKAGGDE